MFENAGIKIKKLAKILFSLEVAASILFAFIFLVENGIDYIIPAVFAALCGFAAAYVSALFLVAFGDLVQGSMENKEINKEILEQLKKSSEG